MFGKLSVSQVSF